MRTIIEIDNGNAAAISGGGKDLADLLVRADDRKQCVLDKLRPFGIQRIVERHPTEPAKVVVGEREIAVR
ncbi:hypothetical protein ACXIT0_24490 [Methylorubrum extorquens]|jgi:hypothetical protein|nr:MULTISPECIES: hypothetical protein [Methylorubrum]MDF9861362.1 hypothetical protein [Methylorubrum pseudosasae]MDH6634989.1 hypothetical protein [Methylobacterium sp. SuP10 SLI 274]MDH6664160.1 hypothetical protein [Methylorubrum zatmanii]MCP1561164.1 hypothetical protein [Methylorubrum extorquens]MDF9789647.1 hypothetical protein [Methylorubrum extorquens]